LHRRQVSTVQKPVHTRGGKGRRPSENKQKERRDTHVTRQKVNKSQTDEEFVAQFKRLTREDQDQRLGLLDYLTPTEFEHRLRLLKRTDSEIESFLREREKPLFDRGTPSGGGKLPPSEEDKDYEKISDSELPVATEKELSPPPLTPKMGDKPENIPDWAQTIISAQKIQIDHQQDQINRLASILEKFEIPKERKEARERPLEIRPVKAEDIFEFKPTDTQDDCEYFLFIERITDFVAQYTEECVRPSLISCLKNARAKQWYASLAVSDKENLRGSTDA
jgi:hypothetical protein